MESKFTMGNGLVMFQTDGFQDDMKGRIELAKEEIEKLCGENDGSVSERWFEAYIARKYGIHGRTLDNYLNWLEVLGEITRKRGKVFHLDNDENDPDEQESIETVIEQKIGKVLNENGSDTFTPAKLLDELDEEVKDVLGNTRKGREGNLGKKLKEMGYGKYRGRTSDCAVYTVDDEEKRDKLKR